MLKKFLLYLSIFTAGELFYALHVNAAADAVEDLEGRRPRVLKANGLARLNVDLEHEEHVYCSPSCKQR